MPAAVTSIDLVTQVRSQIDEASVHTVTDDEILAALNRGQDSAADIMARHYPDPLLDDPYIVPLVAGQISYDIPEDIFEQRLLGVEAFKGTAPSIVVYPLLRVSFSDLNMYESSGQATVPQVYCVIGSKIQVRPIPSGTYQLRMWVLKELNPLVPIEGRITGIDEANGRVFFRDSGTELTTESDSNNSYINFVDGQSGLIKGSAQLLAVTGTDLRIKSTPDRTEVQGKTISGTLPTNLQKDDYICVVKGNCVPIMRKPFSNYMIQFAVCEIKRRLGEDVQQENQALKDFEEEVKHTWAGRENTIRVQKRSKHWYRPTRRWLSS